MSQMNPKEVFHTLHTQFNCLTQPVTPFNSVKYKNKYTILYCNISFIFTKPLQEILENCDFNRVEDYNCFSSLSGWTDPYSV